MRSSGDGQLQQSEAIRDGLALAETVSGFLVLGQKALYDLRIVSVDEQVIREAVLLLLKTV